MEIIAILCIRNEEKYLRQCIESLIQNRIKIFLIDNASTDQSKAIYQSFSAEHIMGVQQLPFRGEFNLQEQLEAKEAIRKELNCDWIIHIDADEILTTTCEKTLFDVIVDADRRGFNVVNFNELVFIPEHDNASYEDCNYVDLMKYFYFFEPQPNRLMRAYKNIDNYRNTQTGGHRLTGENINVYPQNQLLKHYICLSIKHLKRKYSNRIFPQAELKKGWHHNRVNINWAKVTTPPLNKLSKIDKNISNEQFKQSTSYKTHFWQWQECVC